MTKPWLLFAYAFVLVCGVGAFAVSSSHPPSATPLGPSPSSTDDIKPTNLMELYASYFPRVDEECHNAHAVYRFCLTHFREMVQHFSSPIECWRKVDEFRPVDPISTRIQTIYYLLNASTIPSGMIGSLDLPVSLRTLVDSLLDQTIYSWSKAQKASILYFAASLNLSVTTSPFDHVWHYFCGGRNENRRPFPKFSTACKGSIFVRSQVIKDDPLVLRWMGKLAPALWKREQEQFHVLNDVLNPQPDDDPITAQKIYDALQKGSNIHSLCINLQIKFPNEEAKNDFVQQLITYGLDTNFYLGDSVILRSSILDPNRLPWLRGLLSNGMDPDIIMQVEEERALIVSLINRRNETAKLLLICGANPNVRITSKPFFEVRGATPLMITHSKSMVNLLLKKGADVHAHDDRGYTPLFYSSRVVNAKQLINHGANLLHLSFKGITALMSAVKSEHLVRYYLTLGIFDVNAQDKMGWSALHYAFGKLGCVNSIRRLLDAGSDINLPDSRGLTPPMIMSEDFQLHYKTLKDANLNPNLRDSVNMTALHYVSMAGLPHMTQLLLRLKFDINAQNARGSTPLMLAVLRAKIEVVSILLDRGANLSVVDGCGKTALMLARSMGFSEAPMLVSILEKASMKMPSLPPTKGESFDLFALFRKHYPLVDEDKVTSRALHRFCAEWDHQRNFGLVSLKSCFSAAEMTCFSAADIIGVRLQTLFVLLNSTSNIRTNVPMIEYLVASSQWSLAQNTSLLYFSAMKRTYFPIIWSAFCAKYFHITISDYPKECQRTILLLPEKSSEFLPFRRLTTSEAWQKAKTEFDVLNKILSSPTGLLPSQLYKVIEKGANIHALNHRFRLMLGPEGTDVQRIMAAFIPTLVDLGMDVNFHVGNSSLLTFCMAEEKMGGSMLQTLLHLGLNPNRRLLGVPLLILSLSGNRYFLAKLLLQYGADPNMRYYSTYKKGQIAHGMTPLMGANSDCMVKYLIERGADVNATDPRGVNALFYGQTIDVAQALVESGINVHQLSLKGESVLMPATSFPPVLAYLLSLGVLDVNAQTEDEGRSALHHAVQAGDKESIKILLAAGANINIQDELLLTPLMWMKEDMTLNSDMLRAAGIQVDLRNGGGFTSLHYAAAKGFPMLMRTLLDLDADVNALSNDGQTPLIRAVDFGMNVEVVSLLLAFGASIDLGALEGMNVRQLAKARCREEKSESLKSNEQGIKRRKAIYQLISFPSSPTRSAGDVCTRSPIM